MSSEQPGVIVKDLYKSFKLPHEQHNGIKQLLVNFANRKKGYETQHVLEDISFEIQQGEFFGIVGRNGSGKSTLLKLLAGIYAPDKGLVQVNGSLTPFIELGVGFNPELTGRENVFMNGALLGFGRKEMEAMYDEIVQFAELERFMDQKLKNYSSGMQVRLAFSIAIRANTPILLIDEVLAVGDSAFQTKCYAEFRKLRESKRTIIFVTHDMSAVERFCDRVLVLEKGSVKGIYKPEEAAVIYQKMNTSNMEIGNETKKEGAKWGSGRVKVKQFEILDLKKPYKVTQGDGVTLQIEVEDNGSPQKIVIGLAIYDEYGTNLAGPNSKKHTFTSSDKCFKYYIPHVNFVPGEYRVSVALYDKNLEELFEHYEDAIKFLIISEDIVQYGKINLNGKWQ